MESKMLTSSQTQRCRIGCERIGLITKTKMIVTCRKGGENKNKMGYPILKTEKLFVSQLYKSKFLIN